ncbi:hypothetical protein NX794_06180 [Streptomyces sp. LP11]|uniref:Lipoprotein n=1 Tax=Streptomyces pyxinicus TaxID=2970331 RepID=A0ABT2AX41_9ACTN|nr:hypothetical protein [Streptomyces sp. LP11]MCS0600819.1 hypothetical protein [Streptomyces sp. LP11]
MAAQWTRNVLGAVLVAVAVAGCSDTSRSPSGAASKAASAASSLASRGGDALSSATAEARRRLDEAKGGVNAKDQVTLGSVATGGDDRATVEVTARNTAGSAKSFAVQVDFRDKGGNLLDVVVVTLKGVAADASQHATARSNRALGGEVRADVGSALRY